jgi:small subunit ribosomal protein S1
MEEMSNTTTVETEAAPKPTSIEELEPKMKLTGTVTRLELYGAFIDVGVGVNALVHISRLSTGHVNRVSDVIEVGDEVTLWVDKVDPEKKQIMVTLIEPLKVDWRDLDNGQTYTGTITRLENYGAFVDIGAEREGLVHISEISHDYVKHTGEQLTVGDEVQVQVLGFSKRKRRIDLSIKNLLEKPEVVEAAVYSKAEPAASFEEEEEEFEEMPSAMELAFRQAMGDESVDAIGYNRQRRQSRKSRKRKRTRRDQDELLDRTLQFQGDK